MLCVDHRTHSHKEVFHSVFCKQTDIIAELSEDQRRDWSCLQGHVTVSEAAEQHVPEG